MRLEEHEEEIPPVQHTLNTISGGFAGGGETSSARRIYVCQVMQTSSSSQTSMVHNVPELSFSPKDFEGISPHEDDPLVVVVQVLNYNVRRVLIDPGSSADIIY